MRALSTKKKQRRRAERLEPINIRGFGGGLNSAHGDSGMDPKYLVELTGFHRLPSGAQAVQFGQKWFSDVSSVVSGTILDMEYFTDSIIAVMDSGEIAAIDATGNATAIWNSTIAAALVGAPAGWSSGLEYIDFVPYKNELIVHNGEDKPITIDETLAVSYLADLASGSNVNTPIGRFGCVVSNYHCISGLPAAPTTIEISAVGTAGTFVGDPDPNDAISIDIGAFAPEGASEIRGIAGFRANLIAFFRGHAVIIKLGNYVDGAHTPIFPDTFPRFGLLGHRCITTTETDMIFGGLDNIASAKRNLFSSEGLMESKRLSFLIESLYRQDIAGLSESDLAKETFTLNDRLSHDIWLVTPTATYIYSSDDELKYHSWSKFGGPSWSCGCTSFLGRLFLAEGTRVYQSGNSVYPNEGYYSHKSFDRDRVWTPVTSFSVDEIAFDSDTEESYTCIKDHISGATTFEDDRNAFANDPRWELYEGDAVTFRMELPWIDGRDPMQTKQLKYVSIGSKGTAQFTLKAYVDNLYKDANGDVVHDPALSMEFIGNDAFGFGQETIPFGGGRRSTDPRLYKFPVKFKSIKFVFEGSAREKLELEYLAGLFSRGRNKRG